MLSDNTALKVKGISKTFKSYHPNLQTDSAKSSKDIPCLRDISFQLNKGEILGIIGNNGAGKSTLLKIIAGLIKPDEGSVTYRGKLSSILDIGSGFHPDLTGMDNIYMVARLIGYSTVEIDKMLQEIIDFSGLDQFMETQVKHYSSGMFMRLAFSLFTTLKSDILVIDEVLSVGDINFREKSSARIKEIASRGATIIIASHEMRTIQNLSTHGLLLDGGIIKGFDTIRNIIDKYVENDALAKTKHSTTSVQNTNLSIIEKPKVSETSVQLVSNDSESRVHKADIKVRLHRAFVRAADKPAESDIFMNDAIEICFEYEKLIDTPLILSAVIADKLGTNLISLCSYRMSNAEKFVDTSTEGRYVQSVKLPGGLFNQGLFSISFYLADNMKREVGKFEKLLFFKIHKSELKLGSDSYPENYSCPLFPVADWHTIKTL